MKTLKDELNELKRYIDNPAEENEAMFQAKVNEIKQKYPSEEEANIISDFLLKCYVDVNSSLNEIGKEIDIRKQLEKVKEAVSLSYIAKKYFGKSRQWLNNRINGCIVNGKKCQFSNEEKERLNYALSDIGKLLGSIRIS